MAVVIIIGGSGRLKAAVDNANSNASAHNWTQDQKDWMADKFNAYADDIEKHIGSFNAGNPP